MEVKKKGKRLPTPHQRFRKPSQILRFQVSRSVHGGFTVRQGNPLSKGSTRQKSVICCDYDGAYPLHQRDNLRLIHAYTQINDETVKKDLLRFIETIAKREDK